MILLLAMLLAAIDADMTPKEVQKTGMNKLSGKEKIALGEWIDIHYEKKAVAKSEKPPILSENLKSGHFIRLTDNSLWEIDPKDTPITQSWITPVEITVSESDDPDYPYILTNTLTGSEVRAKQATTAQLKPSHPSK